jgi:hypothetical protein
MPFCITVNSHDSRYKLDCKLLSWRKIGSRVEEGVQMSIPLLKFGNCRVNSMNIPKDYSIENGSSSSMCFIRLSLFVLGDLLA